MRTKIRISSIIVSSFLSITALSPIANAASITPYRDAQVENTAISNNHNYVIPLSKIQRSGRGWSPEKVLDVDAQVTRFTFKIPRSNDLDFAGSKPSAINLSFSSYKEALVTESP